MPTRFGRTPMTVTENPQSRDEQVTSAPELIKWRQCWIRVSGQQMHKIVEAFKKQGIQVRTWKDIVSKL